jgi:sugar lactone lactonase YvrE
MCRDFKLCNFKGIGSLYCIKDDVIVNEYNNFTIPNGMDWDDNYFYHIDTFESIIYRYTVEDEINLTNKEEFIRLDASPDGMCLDVDHNIWTALWGDGKVVCISTETKMIIDEIEIDEANASCVSFGANDCKTIYISSGCDEGLLNGSLYKTESNYKGRKVNKYKR